MSASQLLHEAKLGESNSFGELLQLYRNYLRLLAESQLDQKLRRRLGPSDVVQETMLAAHRDFQQFMGTTEREFLAWLRQILIHNVCRMVEKHVLAEKRDVRREVSLDLLRRNVEQSGVNLASILAESGISPSSAVSHSERVIRLADCIAQLPPHYREVLILRNFKSMPFEQVAEEMGRTRGSARVLWLRAIRRLRKIYNPEEQA